MFDLQIFHFINSLAGQNKIIDNFFIFITIFGNFILFLIILLTRDKRLIIKSLLGYIFLKAVDLTINWIYFRPRPFSVQEANLLITQKASASFPSGHAMTAFVFAQLLYFYNRKYGIFAFILAVLVAFSRVFVGVHYPSDTIAGILLGIGAAFIIEYLFEKYKLMKGLEKIYSKLKLN